MKIKCYTSELAKNKKQIPFFKSILEFENIQFELITDERRVAENQMEAFLVFDDVKQTKIGSTYFDLVMFIHENGLYLI